MNDEKDEEKTQIDETGWQMVNVSKEQFNYIKKLIKNSKLKEKYDFRSVPDFIRRAIAYFIEKMRKELEEM